MNSDTLLVTGASSDLARGLLRSLLKKDASLRVLAHCHSGRDRVEELRQEFGDRVVVLEADLSARSGVQHLVSEVRRQSSVLSTIIHFAGRKLALERSSKFDLDAFEQDFSVQVTSLAHLLREFLPSMARGERLSHVIFVLSSVTWGVPPKYMSAYTVVKYAQLGLMRALAAEYEGTKVNINAASPSMVETRFLSNVPRTAIEMAAAQSPTKRNVTVEEVVAAIEFLLSPAADSINGANLLVSSGKQY